MKILHVCPWYFPSQGGNQAHLQTLCEELARLGEEVHVFTPYALEPAHFYNPDPCLANLPTEEKINGVFVRRFYINYPLNNLLFKKMARMKGGYRFLSFFLGQTYEYWKEGPLVPQMLKAIRDLKPDLVVPVMNYTFTTYLSYLAKKRYGIKLAIMPITHVFDQRSRCPFLKTMYKAADGIIACTEFEKKYIMAAQEVPAEKIQTCELGIKLDIFNGADGGTIRKRYNLGGAPVVGYIGRKVMSKGIEFLIEAMTQVWGSCPEAKLLLAGKTRDDFVPVLQKQLNRLTAQERSKVIVVEQFDEAEKKDFYATIDVLAMPSKIDCFGLVYLEAWLAAKPVIACQKTAQESLVDEGINGLLVEYGNSQELAAAVTALFKDRDLRERMGEAGRKKVKTVYSQDQFIRRAHEGYKRLFKGETDVRSFEVRAAYSA